MTHKSQSVYFSHSFQPRKGSQIKKGIRVELVNQDLQQAIQQIKLSFQAKKSGIKPFLHNLTSNPEVVQSSPRKNQKLFFTNNYQKKIETRLQQIEQRKKQLNARSQEKKMVVQINKKIQQNKELKIKIDLVKDIEKQRELLIVDKKLKEKQRKQQEQMLHEASKINAEMLRNSKKSGRLQQIHLIKTIEQQSLKNHTFLYYLSQKQQQNKHMLNNTRFQFLTFTQIPTHLQQNKQIKTTTSRRPVSVTKNININNIYQKQERIIEKYKILQKKEIIEQSEAYIKNQ